jgi:RNA polymerase sigma factor (sigma-70 family)
MANGLLGQVLRKFHKQPGPRATQDPTDGELLERFVTRQDEAAFEALVRRHGPMVLSVCRRVLQDAHEAEDAFQATFLVLVRKAGSIAEPDLLGNWLYGVAFRIAAKARNKAARRSAYERQAASMPRENPLPSEVEARELRTVLDEEMSGLPEKYRAPLVLCYLEGKTNEEAARTLGWPTGSMSSRLARGREMLRERLTRRGLAFAGLPFSDLLSQNAAPTALPLWLVNATVQAAALTVAGKAAGALSPAIAALLETAPKARLLTRYRLAVALFLALILAGAAAAAVLTSGSSGQGQPGNVPASAAGGTGQGGDVGGCHSDNH